MPGGCPGGCLGFDLTGTLAHILIISACACFVVVLVCDQGSSILIPMFVGALFKTRSIHTPFSPVYLLDSSLACAILYTCANVCGRHF